jgi:hypothetical protein
MRQRTAQCRWAEWVVPLPDRLGRWSVSSVNGWPSPGSPGGVASGAGRARPGETRRGPPCGSTQSDYRWHGSDRTTCAPCVLRPLAPGHIMHAMHRRPQRPSVVPWTGRSLRNEKVRGSSPLSSTILNMALTRSFCSHGSSAGFPPVILACAPGAAVDTVLGPSPQRLRRSELLHRMCGQP